MIKQALVALGTALIMGKNGELLEGIISSLNTITKVLNQMADAIEADASKDGGSYESLPSMQRLWSGIHSRYGETNGLPRLWKHQTNSSRILS